MYSISTKHSNSHLDSVQIENHTHKSSVKISPKMGGAVQHLVLNGKTLIHQPKRKNSQQDYFSSVLFPFVNRVENGVFSFNGKQYNLPINEIDKGHALHGFVYDKPFVVTDSKSSKDSAWVSLRFSEKTSHKGLPFDYTIELKYTITQFGLSLKVKVENIGIQSFPFGLGWHPYFHTSSKENRMIQMNSDQKLTFTNEMIPSAFDNVKTSQIPIDKHLDDCFHLRNGSVKFTNENYGFKLTSTTETNYLQIYTPPENTSIAIEMMTSPPNSFNNNKGILVLAPQDHYELEWGIHLIPSTS